MNKEIKTPTQIKRRISYIKTRYTKAETEFHKRAIAEWKNGKFPLKPSIVKDLVDNDMYCDSEVEILKAKLEGWNDCMEFYGN